MEEDQAVWFKKNKLSRFQTFCINVLKTGAVPRHVAIIMDGNRRYAKKHHLTCHDGHITGFEKLTEMLLWCRDLGITEVTTYAFSIENFKRTKEEVDNLMKMAEDRFRRLLQEKDKIMEHGVCIRAFGKLSLLPLELQKLIAEVELLSIRNTKAFLNICIAYTSTEEICQAVQLVVDGVDNGLLEAEDITEDVLQKCLYSASSPDPDLLIRTSGEVRLSDFLLWQCSYSVLAFIDVLWPEFTFWHFLWCILNYQINFPKTQKFKELAMNRSHQRLDDWGLKCSPEKFHGKEECLDISEEQKLNARNERIDSFVNYISSKRMKSLNEMVEGKLTAKEIESKE